MKEPESDESNVPTMDMQGGVASVGLDKKAKRRRPPAPLAQPTMMEDQQNTLAQIAAQRPMLGTDPNNEDLTKRMMYG